MSEDRPGFAQRVQQAVTPKDVRQNRSNAMIVLGVVLFVFVGMIFTTNPEAGAPAILFGVLGAGLIVGGLVIRRR